MSESSEMSVTALPKGPKIGLILSLPLCRVNVASTAHGLGNAEPLAYALLSREPTSIQFRIEDLQEIRRIIGYEKPF